MGFIFGSVVDESCYVIKQGLPQMRRKGDTDVVIF